MKFIAIFLGVIFNFIHVENRMVYEPVTSAIDDSIPPETKIDSLEKMLGLKSYKMDEDRDLEEYSYDVEKKRGSIKKPCAIVVLSNSQNPSMQSLLRKYRYDANGRLVKSGRAEEEYSEPGDRSDESKLPSGVLIPSSVQYFIKVPQQGLRSDPLLVPLNDRAFSPLGGFVRYYKEVPPIPQSW